MGYEATTMSGMIFFVCKFLLKFSHSSIMPFESLIGIRNSKVISMSSKSLLELLVVAKNLCLESSDYCLDLCQ